jgi:hypothetical protein
MESWLEVVYAQRGDMPSTKELEDLIRPHVLAVAEALNTAVRAPGGRARVEGGTFSNPRLVSAWVSCRAPRGTGEQVIEGSIGVQRQDRRLLIDASVDELDYRTLAQTGQYLVDLENVEDVSSQVVAAATRLLDGITDYFHGQVIPKITLKTGTNSAPTSI